MDFAELSQLLLPELARSISTHAGAAVYASERAKFDCWLTVEAFRVLKEAGHKPEPEREKMDIALGRWGIAVRSVVTNIPCEHAKDKKRSIKKSIETLRKDIWRMTNPGQTTFAQRAILFVAFPTEHDNERWQSLHLKQIASELNRLDHIPFQFTSGVPAVVYLGLCTDQ